VYNNFNLGHNKSRKKAYDVMKNLGGVNSVAEMRVNMSLSNVQVYYTTVMQSKFMTSPMGNMLEMTLSSINLSNFESH
jgi:hypothetical protein